MPTLTKEALGEIVKHLAAERPRFCSEADFQFALAWKIQQEFPQAEIRFECPAVRGSESIKIDIIVNSDGELVPIELKYKLKSQGRDTENRPDMLDDIDRLEVLRLDDLDLTRMNLAATPTNIKNRFVIWLSDNDRFWNENSKNKILDYKEYVISWEAYVDDFQFALIDVLESKR